MRAVILFLALVPLVANAQTVDGVKPIDDGARQYAVAISKHASDSPDVLKSADPFLAGFFSFRGKMMAPLMHTKYTAAMMNLSGIIMGLYDEGAAKAFRAPYERIVQENKDFNKLSEAEIRAIGEAIMKDEGPFNPLASAYTKGSPAWRFRAGMSAGSLSAYITVWHLSPKQEILLDWIKGAVESVAKAGSESKEPADKPFAAALAAFSKFKGKTLDAATMGELAAHLSAALKLTLPEKYRWQ